MARPSKAKKYAGRGAKGWATRRANAALKAKEGDAFVANMRLSAAMPVATGWVASGAAGLIGDSRAPQMGTQEIPGRGEIVGGYEDTMALAIVEAARKRDGAEHVKRMIQIEQQKSRAAGIEIERTRQDRLREIRSRCLDERIVCGFIAEVKEAERSVGLPYEMIWTLNSFTLTKVVEALLAAGYRPEGRVRTAE